MEGLSRRHPAVLVLAGAAVLLVLAACAPKPHVMFARDDAAGTLTVLVGGREAFVFQYGPAVDLPHYWPLRSPSGKNMLVQKTEPYPHHRSFWFADTVRPEGGERDLSFYNALYSGTKTTAGDNVPPFRDRIRLVSFPKIEAKNDRAEIVAELAWETDGRAVINEERRLVVHSLGGGEYLLDLTWTLTPAAAEVAFVSDDVHYAWPFLRLDTVWNGEHGGRITSDTGATSQEATNMKPALWIDCSNTVEGVTEGVAVFQWPDGREHRWLTREYGCFGPRRSDDRSGKPFTLKMGDSLAQRAAILVHKGDGAGGRVRERYEKYIKGGWR
ncbi:MAG: hypothetical protein HGA24_02975 [Candidatus Aminicenantes bacterium]|nr:hypothetical protein [Candidatus Aminicenantes bacterium]